MQFIELRDKDVIAMKIARWLAPGLLILSVGCGQSPVTDTGTPSSNVSPTVANETPGDARTPTDGDNYVPRVVNTPAAELPVDVNSPPEAVVTEFLKAMKTSDDGVAAGLLTAVAREETGKHGLAVQPPGSPTAVYEVTASELDTEDPTIAQVGCLWTEKDATGEERTERVVWVLRKQPEGWRVFGMGTEMPTRTEPVLFNFEDPEGMNALLEELNQEMAAMANGKTGGEDEAAPEIRKAGKPEEGQPNSLRR